MTRLAVLTAAATSCAPAVRHYAPPAPFQAYDDPIVAFVGDRVDTLFGATIDLETGDARAKAQVGVCVRRQSGKLACIEVMRKETAEGDVRLIGQWRDLPADSVAVARLGVGRACVLDAQGRVRCASSAGGSIGDEIVLSVEGATELIGVDGAVCARRGAKLSCQGVDRRSKSPKDPLAYSDHEVADVYRGAPCVRLVDDTMICLESRMGDVDDTLPKPAPDGLSLTNVSGIATEGCYLRDGKVTCIGQNSLGQIGNGTRKDAFEPAPTSLPGKATSVSYSGSHGCALFKDQVWCWGRADAFALGRAGYEASTKYPACTQDEQPTRDDCAKFFPPRGHARAVTTPVRVVELSEARDLATGFGVTCALTKGGRVLCVGLGAEGTIDLTPRGG